MKKEIKKDSQYWSIHKEIYMKELDKLDDEIAGIVQTKPYSKEANMFNEKLDAQIEKRMGEDSKVVG
jgi:hypothetical protein|tara:strand:- start:165 stop:365 length:201 start_codon:yes stop_codon:yes gene_type:complete